MEKLEVRLFYELSDHLKQEKLKRFPDECLCRSRLFCPEWNALFSSTRFISTEWADFPANKNRCLVLCEWDCRTRCWAYCFSTRTSKPYFSLCFLDKMFSHAYYQAGLLFVEMQFFQKSAALAIFLFVPWNLADCNHYRQTPLPICLARAWTWMTQVREKFSSFAWEICRQLGRSKSLVAFVLGST